MTPSIWVYSYPIPSNPEMRVFHPHASGELITDGRIESVSHKWLLELKSSLRLLGVFPLHTVGGFMVAQLKTNLIINFGSNFIPTCPKLDRKLGNSKKIFACGRFTVELGSWS
jgi:hypothetical protein